MTGQDAAPPVEDPEGEGGLLPLEFLEGAEAVDDRRLGSLGRVLIVKRPPGPSAAAGWSGHEHLVVRELAPVEDESEESVAILREDAVALGGVEHPGLVGVLGIARRSGREFVVLERPSGTGLPELMSRRELDPARAVAIAEGCASALGELARLGRPHRDFRSSCVFVSKDDAVRVLPLACPTESRVEKRVVEGGGYLGLARYAAPELHPSGGRNPTEKSNIFAFGVVFYEMLTYQSPFLGGTPSRVLLDVKEARPSLPSTLNKSMPEKLDRIVLRCLEKDPERRQASFGALGASLRVSSGRSAPGAGGRTPPSDRSRAPSAVAGGPRSSRRSPASPSDVPRKRAGDVPESRPAAPEPVASAGTAELPAAGPTPSHTTKRTAPMRRPGGLAAMSASQKGIVAAAAVVVLTGVGVLAIWGLGGEAEQVQQTRRTEDVLAQADKLMLLDRHEAAWRLLEARASARETDAERYDNLLRKAYLSHWRARAGRAEADGRWADAEKDLAALLEHETGAARRAVERRLTVAAYHATTAAAVAAEEASDWAAAASALEKAEAIASKAGAPGPEVMRLRADLAFARALRDAGLARAKGDGAAELEHLLDAVRKRPGALVVLKRLEGLGVSPQAAEEALALARRALAAGDLDATELSVKGAARLWPLDKRPPQVSAYLADRRSIEATGMVFVSDADPFVSWGPEERARAFGIDRYEFPGVAGKLPRTSVTWAEARTACRKRGGRLCTLAEWRLAAGGTEGLKYPYGNKYDVRAANTQGTGLAPSGRFERDRSPFGVCDMSGNAAEWTADEREGGRVVAGGDWSSGAERSKCTSAIVFGAGLTSLRVGFRCCRSLGNDTANKDGRDKQGRRGR